MNDKSRITIERLKTLEPIATLSTERLEELVGLANVERLAVGVSVFREGDVDNQTIYLLEGDLQLTSSDGKINKVLTSKDKTNKFPIDDSQPRQASCVSLSRTELVRIDNSVLDYMMMWDQLAVSEQWQQSAVDESVNKSNTVENPPPTTAKTDQQDNNTESATAQPNSGDEDRGWIRRMRHIMAFKNMPPANIKSLLEHMETILVEKDNVIIRQGDSGDYFYVLTEGSAQVTRTIELATLQAGASFGEEALVSGGTRNATVTMTSAGMVMRLAKEDFDHLLKEPLLNRVSADEARARVNKGAVWLDVRHAKEFRHSRMHKALNIPLHEMRMRMSELDKNKEYICYCGTGRRSSAAAFLLAQQGHTASVLNGGIQVMAQELER
jgi:rhodanese-related sulfurtransferase